MKLSSSIIKTYDRLALGIETPKDIFWKTIFFIANPFSDKRRWLRYEKYLEKKLIGSHLKDGVLNYRGIFFPDFTREPKYIKGFIPTYFDIIFFYYKRNDSYDQRSVDRFERCFGTEGTYCYQGEGADITIKEGDVVIDAGAWIGSFSAYASKKGASVHAFEPSTENMKYLVRTSELNGNIKVVPMALHSKTMDLDFSEDDIGSRISDEKKAAHSNILNGKPEHRVSAITLDEYVHSNNIRVDFIKSDIEGNERNMLLGAKEVLKRFAPILSICTYHLPDDREVISRIIKEANPDYKIIQRRMKLYAYVDKKEK